MEVLKRLSFGILFLLIFALLSFLLPTILKSTDLAFAFSLDVLSKLLIFTALIVLSSCLFVIFTSLAQELIFILPVVAVASLLPLTVLPNLTGICLAVGFLISFLLTTLILSKKLKSYTDFQPTNLLSPAIKALGSLLIIVISFAFYLTASLQISKNGFEIPDSFLETVINFSGTPVPAGAGQFQGFKYDKRVLTQATPQLTPEQIQLLRQNPQLLKSFGVDPKVLDTLPQTASRSSTQNTQQTPAASQTTPDITASASQPIKALLKDYLNNLLKPYQKFIAPVLALLFYSSLLFFLVILNLLVSPLVWFIFYLFEKTGFIVFQKEMREVKKLVV